LVITSSIVYERLNRCGILALMTDPKLLVFGGSGYLGMRIVAQAREEWEVTATYYSHQVREPRASWSKVDVGDEGEVMALVEQVGPVVIINAAASNPGAKGNLNAVNTEGAAHVAKAAVKVGARLVHISTDVIFDGDKGSYVEENLPNPLTPYGYSKARAEEEVVASRAQAVILRTSLIYGWHPVIDRHARWVVDDLAAGKPVHLFTDELRSPIWVESLAAAVLELAVMDYAGVLHVAGAQSVSRYDFGVRLLHFHGVETAGIVPASIRERGLVRPADCTLDCSRARALLSTPLPGVDEVLSKHSP
jgi:dTDP-4-dehydrorhamnose reductase